MEKLLQGSWPTAESSEEYWNQTLTPLHSVVEFLEEQAQPITAKNMGEWLQLTDHLNAGIDVFFRFQQALHRDLSMKDGGILDAKHEQMAREFSELHERFYLSAIKNHPSVYFKISLYQKLAEGPLPPGPLLTDVLLFDALNMTQVRHPMFPKPLRTYVIDALHAHQNPHISPFFEDLLKHLSPDPDSNDVANLFLDLAHGPGPYFPLSQLKTFFMISHREPSRLKALQILEPDQEIADIAIQHATNPADPELSQAARVFVLRWKKTPLTESKAPEIQSIALQTLVDAPDLALLRAAAQALITYSPRSSFELLQDRLPLVPLPYQKEFPLLLLRAALSADNQDHWQEALLYTLGNLESQDPQRLGQAIDDLFSLCCKEPLNLPALWSRDLRPLHEALQARYREWSFEDSQKVVQVLGFFDRHRSPVANNP